jgi:hypothetical protein
MDKHRSAILIAGRAVLALAVLFLARGAAGEATHALSGETGGLVPDSRIVRSVPDVPGIEDCDRDDKEAKGAEPRRRTFSGKIEGRVLDTVTGRGVPGVFVQVERERDGRRCISKPTDASGHYLLNVGLSDPDGETFHARTLALDYDDALGSGTSFLGRTLKIDFRVALRPTATLSGTVLDADTEMPIANATVAVACVPACNGTLHQPTRTGPDGRYVLHGVPFSPSGPQESGTPIGVTVPASISSNRCYPPFPAQLEVNDLDVIRDIRLKRTLPCGIDPFPPRRPPLASCATPPSTVDDNGRLVTYCRGPANETDVAVNPQDRLNIVSVAKDYALGMDVGNTCTTPTHATVTWEVWTGLYTSFDGGITWSNDLFPGFPGDTRPTGVPNQRCMSDPVIAFTPNGELYLVAMAWGASQAPQAPLFESPPSLVIPRLVREFHLVLGRSSDGGRSWDIRSIFRGVTTIAWPDKPALAIDPDYVSNGTVYVGWDLVSEPSKAVSPKLTTVVSGEVVSTVDVPGISNFPAPVVLRDHSVVVSGAGSRCDAVSCVAVSRRTMPGNWVPNGSVIGSPADWPTGTTNDYRAPVVPTIAVDRSGGTTDGNVVVAWHTRGGLLPFLVVDLPRQELATVLTPERIFGSSSLKVAYSSDIGAGGSTWNSVDPPAPSGTLHVMPRVAVSSSGVVALLYYEDALSGSTPLTARFLSGMGSGQPTWGTPMTLSAPFSPAKMIHQAADVPVFIGDYVGLTFDATGNALATWADGRRDRSDIFFKSIAALIP